jgi:hypothetical protein
MNRTDFTALLDRTFEAVRTINGSKGMEYADSEEALANFYRRAEEFDLDPKTVAGIFLGKHLDAIKAFIKTGSVRSEPIEGRVHDAILYLVLLLGLVEDELSNEQAIVEHAGENQMQLDLERTAEHLVPTAEEVQVRPDHLPIEHQAHNAVTDTVRWPMMPGEEVVRAADPQGHRFTAPRPRPDREVA